MDSISVLSHGDETISADAKPEQRRKFKILDLKYVSLYYEEFKRRSLLGYIEDQFRSALTIAKAKELFNQSTVRAGNFIWGLLW